MTLPLPSIPQPIYANYSLAEGSAEGPTDLPALSYEGMNVQSASPASLVFLKQVQLALGKWQLFCL